MNPLYKVSNWARYSSYEMQYINNLHYILPTSEATLEVYNPTEQFETMIPALITIGERYTAEKMSDSVMDLVLRFCNSYGLLGLANIMCLHTEGSLDEHLQFKSTFREKSAQISVQNYIRLFSPTAKKGDLVLIKSENRVHLHLRNNPEGYKDLVCKANELLNLIFSPVYAEPLTVFLMFSGHMYRHFRAIESGLPTKMPKILITAPRCTHLSTEDGTAKVQYIFTSLCSALSFVYVQMLAEPKRLLKTCKHCGEVFYANNPKAQFCSGTCRNRYNVYKSRQKQETQG